MLRQLVLFAFIALCISFAIAEAPADVEPAKPVNIEPLRDAAKESDAEDLETDATSYGGYYNGWGGRGHYGSGWNVRPWYGGGWGSGWGGRGYGSGWNRGYGWGGHGYGWGGRGYGGWGGYQGGYWG